MLIHVDLLKRVQQAFAPIRIILRLMLPLFLQIVLYYHCLLLNLRSEGVWALNALQMDFTLDRIYFKWVNFGNDYTFLDIDHVYINILSTLYLKSWLLLLFLARFKGWFRNFLSLVKFLLSIYVIFLILGIFRFLISLWKFFRLKVPLLDNCQNLISWVAQRQLIKFLSHFVLLLALKLSFLTVNTLVAKVRNQVTIDWIKPYLSIFKT